jgi:hypothetical protein
VGRVAPASACYGMRRGVEGWARRDGSTGSPADAVAASERARCEELASAPTNVATDERAGEARRPASELVRRGGRRATRERACEDLSWPSRGGRRAHAVPDEVEITPFLPNANIVIFSCLVPREEIVSW